MVLFQVPVGEPLFALQPPAAVVELRTVIACAGPGRAPLPRHRREVSAFRNLRRCPPQPLAETAEHRIFGSGPPKQPLTPTLEYDVGNGEQHRQMTEHVHAKSRPNFPSVLR